MKTLVIYNSVEIIFPLNLTLLYTDIALEEEEEAQEEEDGFDWWYDEELDDHPSEHCVHFVNDAHRGQAIDEIMDTVSESDEAMEDEVQYLRSVAPRTSGNTRVRTAPTRYRYSLCLL